MTPVEHDACSRYGLVTDELGGQVPFAMSRFFQVREKGLAVAFDGLITLNPAAANGVRAAHHGRSTETEVRDILDAAVRPSHA